MYTVNTRTTYPFQYNKQLKSLNWCISVLRIVPGIEFEASLSLPVGVVEGAQLIC